VPRFLPMDKSRGFRAATFGDFFLHRWTRLLAILLVLAGWWGTAVPAPADPGQFTVAASVFDQAVSLSRGRALDLSTQPLVLSNSPEFPNRPGILCKMDNVMSGRFRLLYSHKNLLFDPRNPRVDDPATIGVAVVNHTGRAVSLFWTRMATMRTTDRNGTLAGPVDYAPAAGGSGPGPDFGGREGTTLVEKWFASGDGDEEHRLADLAPGGSYLYQENVGPGAWAMGLFDFVLRDQKTGQLVTPVSDGGIGVEVLITRYGTDFTSFYRLADKSDVISPADDAPGAPSPTPFHQRGIFAGADRTMTIRYDPGPGVKPVAVQVAQQYFARDSGPDTAPGYEPDMFVNDVSANGLDDHVRAQDSGNYGIVYVFRLQLSGPAAVAVQPALYSGPLASPDMYDQHLVFDLDGVVRTVSFRDPGYAGYYRSPRSLQPLGQGHVVFDLPYAVPGHTYVLRTTLPPNGYGPFVIMIMPAPGPGGRWL